MSSTFGFQRGPRNASLDALDGCAALRTVANFASFSSSGHPHNISCHQMKTLTPMTPEVFHNKLCFHNFTLLTEKNKTVRRCRPNKWSPFFHPVLVRYIHGAFSCEASTGWPQGNEVCSNHYSVYECKLTPFEPIQQYRERCARTFCSPFAAFSCIFIYTFSYSVTVPSNRFATRKVTLEWGRGNENLESNQQYVPERMRYHLCVFMFAWGCMCSNCIGLGTGVDLKIEKYCADLCMYGLAHVWHVGVSVGGGCLQLQHGTWLESQLCHGCAGGSNTDVVCPKREQQVWRTKHRELAMRFIKLN